MTHLDGNALAGALSELFLDDMTLATGTCAGCGDEAELARAMVYADAPGLVVRCSRCGDVLMTVVRSPGDTRVSMPGITILTLPR
jgi:ribosomal protein S27E